MNTLTVYPPCSPPVHLAVQGAKVYSIAPISQPTAKWLIAEGFSDLMLGKISEDIVFESGLIDLALTESEKL